MANNISSSYLSNSSININTPSGTYSVKGEGGPASPGSQPQIELRSGDAINGEIVSRDGADVQLKIARDIIINARLDQDIQASAGDQVTFEIRANSNGSISLRPLYQNMSQESPVFKALLQAELPVDGKSAQMVEAMMREGMKIDSESLQTMYKNVMDMPDTSVNTLVQMSKLELNFTDTNIARFEAYKNFEHHIEAAFEKIADEIPGAIDDAFSTGSAKLGNDLMGKILDAFSFENNGLRELDIHSQRAEVVPDLTLGGGSGQGGLGAAAASGTLPGAGPLAGEGPLASINANQAASGAPSQGVPVSELPQASDNGASAPSFGAAGAAGEVTSQPLEEGSQSAGQAPPQPLSGEAPSAVQVSGAPVEELPQASGGTTQASSAGEVSLNGGTSSATAPEGGSVNASNSAPFSDAAPAGVQQTTTNSSAAPAAGQPSVLADGGHAATNVNPNGAADGGNIAPNTQSGILADGSDAAVNPQPLKGQAAPYADQSTSSVNPDGEVVVKGGDPSHTSSNRVAVFEENGGQKQVDNSFDLKSQEGRLNLSDKDARELSNLIKTAGGSEELAERVRYGRASVDEVFEAVRSLSHKARDEESMNSVKDLFMSKGFRTVLKERVSGQWTIRNPEQIEKQGIKDLYERIDKQTREVARALADASRPDSPLARSIVNVRENVDFMNQLNQLTSYVQLPLKWQGMDAHGDLYVYTNKKNLAGKDGQISAFLHLEMQHLGVVDCYVAMERDRVSTNFTVEDDETLDLLDRNMDILTKRLEEKGYTISSRLSLKGEDEGEADGAMSGILKDKRNISVISMQAFDVRA